MDIKQTQRVINKIVTHQIDKMHVICKITDVKQAYGRFIYKLIPMAGSGYKWTNKVPGSAELPFIDKEETNAKRA